MVLAPKANTTSKYWRGLGECVLPSIFQEGEVPWGSRATLKEHITALSVVELFVAIPHAVGLVDAMLLERFVKMLVLGMRKPAVLILLAVEPCDISGILCQLLAHQLLILFRSSSGVSTHQNHVSEKPVSRLQQQMAPKSALVTG